MAERAQWGTRAGFLLAAVGCATMLVGTAIIRGGLLASVVHAFRMRGRRR